MKKGLDILPATCALGRYRLTLNPLKRRHRIQINHEKHIHIHFFLFSQIEAMINFYIHKVCKKQDLESYRKTKNFNTNISSSYLASKNGQPLIDVFFDYKFTFIKREDFVEKFNLDKEEIFDKKKLFEYFLFDLTK
jgi:hypothetical protein